MPWAWARRAAAFPRERPVVFGCVFSALKTAFADYLVQRHFEERTELDLRRTAVFTLFGFGYLGGWQYFLYVKCFPRWFPAAAPFASKSIREKLADRAGQLAVAKQVAAVERPAPGGRQPPIVPSVKEWLAREDAEARRGQDANVAGRRGT